MNRCTVRVELPNDLVMAVTDRVGVEHFDAFVVAAVEKRVRLEMLDDLLAELDAQYGPVPAEIREQTAKMWPTFENED